MVELADLLYDPRYSSERWAFLYLYKVHRHLERLKDVFFALNTGPVLVRPDGSPLAPRRVFQYSSDELEDCLVDIWIDLSLKEEAARHVKSSASSILPFKGLVSPYLHLLETSRQRAKADGCTGDDSGGGPMVQAYNTLKAQIWGSFAHTPIEILDLAGINPEQFDYLVSEYESLQVQSARR